MKKEKLFRFAFVAALAATIILAVSLVISLVQLFTTQELWENLGYTSVQIIGTYQILENVILASAGLIFAVWTLVVLHRGQLFDIRLGNMIITIAVLNMALSICSFAAAHLLVGILPALSSSVLMLLIGIIYSVGAHLENENALTI